MIGSTWALAMGLALFVAVRLADAPQRFGLAIFVAALLVALGCAMHLGAAIGGLGRPPPTARAGLILVSWVVAGAATAWALARAPGDELLVVMIWGPITVGVIGLAARPSGQRWHAVPFVAVAVALALVLGPVWLARQTA